jgi:hypothetical protein
MLFSPSKSKNDANELNLYKVLKDSMNNWFGDIDGVDTSNWTTIWLKDHKEVILKVLARSVFLLTLTIIFNFNPVLILKLLNLLSEAHKILNSISMHSCVSLETNDQPLSLNILSHSHCLVNLS